MCICNFLPSQPHALGLAQLQGKQREDGFSTLLLGQLNCLPLAFRKSNQTPKTIADRLQLASSSQTTERKKGRPPHTHFLPLLTFDSLPGFYFSKIIWNCPQRGQHTLMNPIYSYIRNIVGLIPNSTRIFFPPAFLRRYLMFSLHIDF